MYAYKYNNFEIAKQYVRKLFRIIFPFVPRPINFGVDVMFFDKISP